MGFPPNHQTTSGKLNVGLQFIVQQYFAPCFLVDDIKGVLFHWLPVANVYLPGTYRVLTGYLPYFEPPEELSGGVFLLPHPDMGLFVSSFSLSASSLQIAES